MNSYLFKTLLLSFFYVNLGMLRLELVIRNQLTRFCNLRLLPLFIFLSKLLTNVLEIFTFRMDQYFALLPHFIILNTIYNSLKDFLLRSNLSHSHNLLNKQTRISYPKFLIWFRNLSDLLKNRKKKLNFYL